MILLRFALLRSIATTLRGVRGRKSGSGMKDLAHVNFDFVPEGGGGRTSRTKADHVDDIMKNG